MAEEGRRTRRKENIHLLLQQLNRKKIVEEEKKKKKKKDREDVENHPFFEDHVVDYDGRIYKLITQYEYDCLFYYFMFCSTFQYILIFLKCCFEYREVCVIGSTSYSALCSNLLSSLKSIRAIHSYIVIGDYPTIRTNITREDRKMVSLLGDTICSGEYYDEDEIVETLDEDDYNDLLKSPVNISNLETLKMVHKFLLWSGEKKSYLTDLLDHVHPNEMVYCPRAQSLQILGSIFGSGDDGNENGGGGGGGYYVLRVKDKYILTKIILTDEVQNLEPGDLVVGSNISYKMDDHGFLEIIRTTERQEGKKKKKKKNKNKGKEENKILFSRYYLGNGPRDPPPSFSIMGKEIITDDNNNNKIKKDEMKRIIVNFHPFHLIHRNNEKIITKVFVHFLSSLVTRLR